MRRKLIEQVLGKATFCAAIATGAQTATGSVIDRQGYLSAHFFVQAGTITAVSTPSQTITSIIYHSNETTSTSFSTYQTSNYSLTITAANSATISTDSVDVDLSGANRYIQIRLTGSVTNTSSLSVPFSVACILGDAENEPAT